MTISGATCPRAWDARRSCVLAVAALRDKDRKAAKNILQGLVAEFPQNRLYTYELGRLN